MTSSMRVYEYKMQRKARTLSASESAVAFAPQSHDAAVAATVRAIVGDVPREHVFAFYVDTTNRLLGYELLGIGSASSVGLACVDLLRSAIVSGASAVILAHNHPSDVCEPSKPDDDLTREAAKCLGMVGIRLLDHVIACSTQHYSYASCGRMPRT